MKTIAIILGSCLLGLLVPSAASAQDADKQWVVYEGTNGPGKGKHIVFISGDDEYRSEEALPQLARIAAVRHGFKCTVLFAINPDTGLIQPNYQTNIPGTNALDTADLMVIATRFRNLPDEQMVPIDNYLKRGGPVVGLRTATHAFNIKDKTSKWAHYSNGYNGEKKEWRDGFGRMVLGEKWISHHGKHKDESARGVVADEAKGRPIARGLSKSDIWGPSDVYGIRLNKLPDTFKPVVMGMVVKRPGKRDDKDALYGMRPTDKEINKTKSDPAMPIAWTKMYKHPEGKQGRAFNTMGAATDIISEGTRKMIFNGMYWALGMGEQIPENGTDVKLVGTFDPTPFGFGTFRKNLKVSDFEMEMPKSKKDEKSSPQASVQPANQFLKVLDAFAGEWEEQVDMGDDNKATATGSTKWIMGGTHLQSTFEVKVGDETLHHMAVMTYDQSAQTYVSWMFSSGGPPKVFRGSWDEEGQKFTQTGLPDSDGNVTHVVSRIISENKIEWTAIVRDQDGELQQRMDGVDTRREI